MAYPTGIDSVNITGTFMRLKYSGGLVSTAPQNGFVHITPAISKLTLLTTGVNYDMEELVNSYYKLDSNGSFTASLIITNQADIEPTEWSYTVKFSWTDKVLTVIPSSATTINISNSYVS